MKKKLTARITLSFNELQEARGALHFVLHNPLILAKYFAYRSGKVEDVEIMIALEKKFNDEIGELFKQARES